MSANFLWDKMIDKFSVFLQYQYSFKQNRIAEYETLTDAYSLVNAGICFGFNLYGYQLQVNAAVNNLLDKRYYDHLSRYKEQGIYNIGRNFVFKLAIPMHVMLKKENK